MPGVFQFEKRKSCIASPKEKEQCGLATVVSVRQEDGARKLASECENVLRSATGSECSQLMESLENYERKRAGTEDVEFSIRPGTV